MTTTTLTPDTLALGARGSVLAIRDEIERRERDIEPLRATATNARRQLARADRIMSPGARDRVEQDAHVAIAAAEAAERALTDCKTRLEAARHAQQRVRAEQGRTPAGDATPITARLRDCARSLVELADAMEQETAMRRLDNSTGET
jgi:hypothetical protein